MHRIKTDGIEIGSIEIRSAEVTLSEHGTIVKLCAIEDNCREADIFEGHIAEYDTIHPEFIKLHILDLHVCEYSAVTATERLQVLT